jgi:glycosyltransferase involved in cell wall biosynthesis
LKDVIVCVNPVDVSLADEVGIKAREAVVAVPNGIDLPKFDAALLPRPQARDKLSLGSEFVFGTTANFYPPKDLPRYLEACKLVHEAEPNTRFQILGEGMQRAEIETKRDSLGLKDIVSLPGARDDASALLAGYDAFVLPSSKEGMAFSLLEAMAARLPCVATDVGAAKWMLDDSGLVVPKMDPQALAEAMLRVMREPGLKGKLAQGARKQIESRFPLETTYQGNLRALTS